MLLDLLDKINLIDRADGLLGTLRHGGAHTFRLSHAHRGADVEALLRRYHVRVFGRRITSRQVIFSVPRQQASWAEYIMLRAGIVPDGPMLDPRNAQWAGRHPAGQAPPPWSESGRWR